MIIAVEIGELHLQDEEGNWITASVSKGFAEIMSNVCLRTGKYSGEPGRD